MMERLTRQDDRGLEILHGNLEGDLADSLVERIALDGCYLELQRGRLTSSSGARERSSTPWGTYEAR